MGAIPRLGTCDGTVRWLQAGMGRAMVGGQAEAADPMDEDVDLEAPAGGEGEQQEGFVVSTDPAAEL